MSLNETIKDLNKKYGDVVSRPDELKDGETDIPSVSTGIYSLDKMFGCGGVPRGRVIEIYGAESSGKSTLARALQHLSELGISEIIVMNGICLIH